MTGKEKKGRGRQEEEERKKGNAIQNIAREKEKIKKRERDYKT